MDCIFCKLKDYVLENELAYAVFDVMPVNPGHLLIIPKRHVSPDGYNFGVNCNECAGQTVMHVHMHLIPRYKGDTKFVHGGVRGVIPEKMSDLEK